MARPNVVPWDRARPNLGNGSPRIETPPARELAAGVAVTEPELEPLGPPPYPRGSDAAREAGRRGGRERAGRVEAADAVGMSPNAKDPRTRRAAALAKAEAQHLRANVGGGKLSPGVRVIVKLAAWATVAAEQAYEEGRDDDGARHGEVARQHLLAAHAKAAKEAQNRPKTTDDLTARLLARRAAKEGNGG